MATVTLDDAEEAGPGSQVVLVVGHGVPLAVRGARSAEGLPNTADSDDDIDGRTAALTAAPSVIGVVDPGDGAEADSSYDYDYDYDLDFTLA